ncbi:Os08g0446850 [Oryza sativa Japonica Group]|uniref:Uncharacterized protein n=2 Tax=Oryza sativa subsp. japonica TaxID=39947 RepID=Q6ZCU1_ORYSJ|nr:hypothetical protein [Oryza sativa Japonica Group]BAD09814.1 hypothetical protein [Oryza sativa Japonica Group]BAT05674.1 Os08g0446850 [Oryza sativa Japonica Group]
MGSLLNFDKLLEDAVDEGVHNGHGLRGYANVHMYLLQYLEHIDLLHKVRKTTRNNGAHPRRSRRPLEVAKAIGVEGN